MKKSIFVFVIVGMLFTSCYFYDEIKGVSSFCDVARGTKKVMKGKSADYLVPVDNLDPKFSSFLLKYPKILDKIKAMDSELNGKLYIASFTEEEPLKGVSMTYVGDIFLYTYTVEEKAYMNSFMRFDIKSIGKTVLGKAHSMSSEALVLYETGVVLDGYSLVESSAEPSDADIANYVSSSNLEGWSFKIKLDE